MGDAVQLAYDYTRSFLNNEYVQKAAAYALSRLTTMLIVQWLKNSKVDPALKAQQKKRTVDLSLEKLLALPPAEETVYGLKRPAAKQASKDAFSEGTRMLFEKAEGSIANVATFVPDIARVPLEFVGGVTYASAKALSGLGGAAVGDYADTANLLDPDALYTRLGFSEDARNLMVAELPYSFADNLRATLREKFRNKDGEVVLENREAKLKKSAHVVARKLVNANRVALTEAIKSSMSNYP